MDRSSRLKINKEALDLNCTIDQMDRTDIYRTCHPTTAKYTIFSYMKHSSQQIMLGHKINVNKLKKIEILSRIFSDHNGIRLEINDNRKLINFINTWKLNNMLLNNHRVNEEIKRDILKIIETNDNENTAYQKLWHTAKQF